MEKDIKEILKIAVEAPSGNNSQPWRFEVSKNIIEVFNIPDKDKILFNYKNRGSLVAHGALLQNIILTSKAFGYLPSVKIIPGEKKNLTARVILEESESQEKDILFNYIKLRSTNRRPYSPRAVKADILQNIREAFGEGIFKLYMSESKDDIENAAEYFSIGDRLIFENESVHHALFSTISWTKKEEERKKEGLYVGTKELSPLDRFIFKNLLSSWSFLKNFAWLGIASKGQEKRKSLYMKSSVIGVLAAPDLSEETMIKGGMALQRIWLTCAKEGVAFQPLTVGMLYLGQKVLDGDVDELSSSQQELVKDGYLSILQDFVEKGMYPIFSFRLGYANPPTAQSIKKLPDIMFK